MEQGEGLAQFGRTRLGLRRILERIRNDGDQALTLLNDAQARRALGWKCTGCGHVKHFTKPVSLEVVARCPRCKSDQFVAIL
jgi:predicted Zn-ribbon and HTH transcriptional regulator